MSRRGRPKQPLSVIQGKGKSNHLTKEEIKKREEHEVSMRGDVDNIIAPSYLTIKQKEEFDLLAVELVKLDIFSNLDVDNLARYIDSRDQYIKITRSLRAMKTTEKVLVETGKLDEHGKEILKEVTIANKSYGDLQRVRNTLFTECRSAAGDLGLSITSRLSLVIPKKDDNKPKTEAERRFGGRL
ncbi:phage terminase small subunit P27 family [Pseudogracilibacillus auburnensis]|uniref:P27 family predicted phage terminase small subunit n=1 Tax=Pseudogracilibacillus auburnensis TaxID=1494959 RepID=A0A2V3W4A2_9BACI|nr:phage terminase small subunit P27 family [Pseudogracilibacillus auburnensis]MBO1003748.1 phage terminase small subunit P27 family [Pseudogracilibacillus auburnensis]PXW88810.1 P27 family predicted phage terminase small subunit [Pseudogracilibacillus auburnensis]